MKSRDIISFANDWDAPPTGKHHLMRLLARENQILWVESSGMRTPSFGSRSDVLRVMTKVKKFLRPAVPVEPNVRVLTPPTLPIPSSSIVRRANALAYRASIVREQWRTGRWKRPCVWAFTPHVAPLIRWLEPELLIYYCVDRWSAFSEYDAGLMESWGEEMCSRADVVLASARELVELCEEFTEDVHYVPHGVDHPHFASALEPGPLPPDLREIPEPRVGFFGLIHDWVDLQLLRNLARETPYSYVLIGDAKVDVEMLEGMDNVHLLGRRPYDDLPDYCRGFHAGIVPFLKSDLTRSVNPIKLREYAAAGLPVVATDLPEMRECSDLTTCVSSHEEWKRALAEAVQKGASQVERRQQSARAASRDWPAVLREIDEIVAGSRVASRQPASALAS